MKPVPVIVKGMAIVRRGGEILLVHQKRPKDARPNWGLPGGKAEEGESPGAAMKREVREETGLVVRDVGALAYAAEHVEPHGEAEKAFVFDVRNWEGDPRADDPDGSVFDLAFVPLPEAIRRLQDYPDAWEREPLLAYLQRPDRWVSP